MENLMIVRTLIAATTAAFLSACAYEGHHDHVALAANVGYYSDITMAIMTATTARSTTAIGEPMASSTTPTPMADTGHAMTASISVMTRKPASIPSTGAANGTTTCRVIPDIGGSERRL
jgi:hypothetical protein